MHKSLSGIFLFLVLAFPLAIAVTHGGVDTILQQGDSTLCALKVPAGKEGEACSNERPCQKGYLACIEGVCAFPKEGMKCISHQDCVYFGLRCLSGVCQARRPAGDVCSWGDQCGSNECHDLVCTGRSAKQVDEDSDEVVQNAEACDSRSDGNQCEKGAYCPSLGSTPNRCLKSGKVGEECFVSFDIDSDNLLDACVPGAFCSFSPDASAPGKCVAFNSLEEGAPCGASWAYEWQCKPGLKCVGGDLRSVGKCETVEMCNNDNPCPQAAHCDCSTGSEGKCVLDSNVDCENERSLYVKCLQEKKCPNSIASVPFIAFEKSTCLHECLNALKALQCCTQKNHEDTFAVLPGVSCEEMTSKASSEEDATDDDSSTSSSDSRRHKGVVILLLILGVVVGILLIMLVVQWSRRRNNIDPLNY